MTSQRRASLPDAKAALADAADRPTRIVFGSGRGDDMSFAAIAVGAVLHVVAVPPRWASPDLLMAFSDRATATVTGRCPRCEAITNLTISDAGQLHGTFAHEHDCWACDAVLVAMLNQERPARPTTTPPRNAPCPCGCGAKAKRCQRRGNP